MTGSKTETQTAECQKIIDDQKQSGLTFVLC